MSRHMCPAARASRTQGDAAPEKEVENFHLFPRAGPGRRGRRLQPPVQELGEREVVVAGVTSKRCTTFHVCAVLARHVRGFMGSHVRVR